VGAAQLASPVEILEQIKYGARLKMETARWNKLECNVILTDPQFRNKWLQIVLKVRAILAIYLMKGVLASLLLGSYAILFWLWKENRKARLAAPGSPEATQKSVS
jgi:hypothetical protein